MVWIVCIAYLSNVCDHMCTYLDCIVLFGCSPIDVFTSLKFFFKMKKKKNYVATLFTTLLYIIKSFMQFWNVCHIDYTLWQNETTGGLTPLLIYRYRKIKEWQVCCIKNPAIKHIESYGIQHNTIFTFV